MHERSAVGSPTALVYSLQAEFLLLCAALSHYLDGQGGLLSQVRHHHHLPDNGLVPVSRADYTLMISETETGFVRLVVSVVR